MSYIFWGFSYIIKAQFKFFVQVKYPGNHLRLMQSLEETSPGQYTTEMLAHTDPNQPITMHGNYRNGAFDRRLDQEASAELNIPNYRPIKVSGNIRGDGNQYTTNAAYQYGNERYTASGEYQKKARDTHGLTANVVSPRLRVSAATALKMGTEKSLTLDITLNDPYRRNSRHITLDTRGVLTYSQASGSFDVKWDADQDQSKAFHLESSMEKTDSSYRAEMEMSYPGRTVRSAFNTEFSGELKNGRLSSYGEFEWAAGKKIAADATFSNRINRYVNDVQVSVGFTTPFREFEQWTLNATHFNDRHQFRCLGSFAWDRYNRVGLKVNGKLDSTSSYYSSAGTSNVALSARFTSPFRNFEDLSSGYTYSYENQAHTVHLDAQWTPRDKLNFEASLKTLPNSQYDLSATFTSPFRNFEALSGKVTYSEENRANKVHLEAQWTPVDKINFDGSLKFLANRANFLETSAMFTSPFRGFELIGFNGRHTNDQQHWACNWELQYSSKERMTFKLDAKHPTWQDMELSALFKSPFKNVEVFGKHTSNDRKFNTNAFFTMDGKKIALDQSLTYNLQGNRLNIDGLVKFTSPFSNFEEIELSLTHASDSSRLNTAIVLTHPRNRHSLTLEYNNNGDSRNSLITAGIRSSSSMYEPFSADLKYTSNGYAYDTVFNVQLPEFPKYTVTNHFAYRTNHGEFSLQYNNNKPRSYYGGKQLYEIGWAYDFEDREGYRTTAYYLWNDQRSELSGRFQNLQNSYINLELSLKSPYRGFEALDLQTSLRNQRNADMTGTFSFQWEPTKKIDFNARFLNANKKKVTVTFTSPFENFEIIKFDSQLQETANRDYNGMITFQWTQRDSMTLTARILDRSLQHKEIKLDFTSSFRAHEAITFEAQYDLTAPEYTARTLLQWSPNDRIVFTGSLGQRNINLQFTSPFTDFEELIFTLSYDIRNQDYSGLTSFQWASNKKIQLSGSFSDSSAYHKELGLQWTSPFYGFEELSWSSTYDNRNAVYSITGSFQWARNKKTEIAGSVSISQPNHKELNIHWTRPSPDYGVSLNVAYDRRNRDHTVETSFKWADRKVIEIIGQFQNSR